MWADSAEDLGVMIASWKVALQMMFAQQLAEMIATELVVKDSAAAAAVAGCEIA